MPKDFPLERDIVCFDCAEAEAEDGISGNKEDEPQAVTASVGSATYKLGSRLVEQSSEKCSYKIKRGYKCIHGHCNPDEVVLCSSSDCSSKCHLVCYLNFLGKLFSN